MTQEEASAGQGGPTAQGEKERSLSLVKAILGDEAYRKVKAADDSGLTPCKSSSRPAYFRQLSAGRLSCGSQAPG